MMKDVVTPVATEDVRNLIKKCLETAAFINYMNLTTEAQVEGNYLMFSSSKLDDNWFCII